MKTERLSNQAEPLLFCVVTSEFAHRGVACRTHLLTWPCISTHFARHVMSRSNQAFNSGMTIAVLL